MSDCQALKKVSHTVIWKVCAVLLLPLFCRPSELPAGEKWTRESSEHFVFYSHRLSSTDASLLERLEAAHDFFLQTEFASGVPAKPVLIVAFRNRTEYAAFQVQPSAFAYFRNIRAQDYIVVQQLESGVERVLLHEYAHAVLLHSGIALPLALQEGLAEVFATIEPRGSSFEVGAALADRTAVLRRGNRYTVQKLLQVDRPLGNPSESAQFYAESWALCHMLLFAPAYDGHWQEFLAALRRGEPVIDAIQSAYHTDFVALSRDLGTYLEKNAFRSQERRIVPSPHAIAQPSAIPDTDIGLNIALADLAVAPPSLQSGAIEGVLSSIPASMQTPALDEALAYQALRRNDRDGACHYFRQAIDKGTRNARTYLAYGRLEQDAGVPLEALMPLLVRAVELDGNNRDAQLNLGVAAARTGQYSLAISTLSPLLADEAHRFLVLYTLAYSQVKSGHLAEGLQMCELAEASIADPSQQSRIRTLLQYISTLRRLQ